MVCWMVLAACQRPPPASPRPLNPPSTNKLGVHLLLDDGRNTWPVALWPEHLRAARRVIGEWGYVTALVRLDDLDLPRWQEFMDRCADLHLTPILRLATTFDRPVGYWNTPPADSSGGYAGTARRYASFVAGLRWPTADHLVVVGNEPNHGGEWGGRPDPAAYVRFLVEVAAALHTADPGARVLNAGFDPYAPHTNGLPLADGSVTMDEESFLDGMVAARPDVFRHIDAWASHSYPLGPFTRPPWEQAYGVDMLNGASNPRHADPPAGIANRGVNGYEWELWKLSTYGAGPLPVLITETGWRHAETAVDSVDNAPLPLPDASTAAAYLDLTLRGNHGSRPGWPENGWTPWLADPRVVAITPFALDGSPAEWGHSNWLILNPQGAILGDYPLPGAIFSP